MTGTTDDRPGDDPSTRPDRPASTPVTGDGTTTPVAGDGPTSPAAGGTGTGAPAARGAVATRGRGPRESPTAVATLAQAPLILVLIGVAIGVGLAINGSWRIGAGVIGLAVALGAVQRLVLPERLVGLLQVRSRPFDVVALAVLAVGIMVLAVVVPAST